MCSLYYCYKDELMINFPQAKLVERANIVWRNGAKKITSVEYLFEVFDLCRKYEIKEPFVNDIKEQIWSQNFNKDVWAFVASKELQVSVLILE